MDRDRVILSKLNNLAQTVILLLIMSTVTGLAAYMVAGPDGILIALATAVIPLFLSNRFAVQRILQMRRARALPSMAHPQLHLINEQLSRRAGLPRTPELWYEPSRTLNAWAAGDRDRPVIVFTDQLLRQLPLREIAGILGHEIAHIRNNDLKVMSIADNVQRVTSLISVFVQLSMVLALPFVLAGVIKFAFVPTLFIILTPTMCTLLQLALSRTREFEADLVGVELTGDPEGLASALSRLERNGSFWQRLLLPTLNRNRTSWLQTHPATSERISRLLKLRNREHIQTKWSGNPQTRLIRLRPTRKLISF